MVALDKIIENIKMSNFNKFDISALVIYLKKNDENIAADYLPFFYDVALKSREKGFNFESVMILIYCYNRGFNHQKIYEHIISDYFFPFVDHLKNNYNRNVNLFKEYEYIFLKNFPDYSELKYLIMPLSLSINKLNGECIKYDKVRGRFEYFNLVKIDIKSNFDINFVRGQRNILCDVYDVDYINNIHYQTNVENIFSFKTPVYLYYESFEDFFSYLQVIDFSECLSLKMAVFLFGLEELESYLLKPEVILNGMIITPLPERVQYFSEVITRIIEKKEKKFFSATKELEEHYSKLTVENIIKKINDKTVRIGFMVSKWTTALQYYIRDCNEACKVLGITSEVFTEKSLLSCVCGNNRYEMVNFLLNFKPDIVLIIDHFRWQWPVIPKQLVYICWIQDTMPHLFEPSSVKKLQELDFVLSLYQLDKIKYVGYSKECYIPGPIPANASIYKKYALSEKEMKEFTTDICIISNSGNAKDVMDTMIFSSLNKVTNIEYVNKFKDLYNRLYDKIFDDIYHEKKSYYSVNDAEKVFSDHLKTQNYLQMSIDELKQSAFFFWSNVISAMYKDVIAIWLHERNYNFKLWGKAWTSHPVLKKYSMGVAPNGETMSKILNASRVSIGFALNITLHPRIMESLFSGSLCIQNDLPASDDWCSVRSFFKLGKELILFKSKKDLYAKIDYFLSNEDERKRVVDAGCKKALDSLTYEAVMQKTIETICERLTKLQ